MQVASLEDTYGDFYVPAFSVRVGTDDLVRDLFLTVTSVDVDLKEKTPGRFTFKVANAFDWEQRAFVAGQGDDRVNLIDLFEFGSPVDIRMGYGDPSGLPTLLTGIVTEIGTSFSEGSVPELTVSGYDKLYALVNGQIPDAWEQVRDSDVVSELVQPTGLVLDVQQTTPIKERIEKGQEADIAFLAKLADRNRFTFWALGNNFYFGPRRNTGAGLIELAWGKGLLSFTPEANLARQVQEVEVVARLDSTGEQVTGRASVNDVSDVDGGREAGPQRVASALNSEPALRIRAAVHSQAEADELARSILEERSQQFVTGDGESVGLPDIVPDINIDLTGLGAAFSKTYYVSGATHKISNTGYRTSFNVQETAV